MTASAAFQLKVESGSYADAGEAVDATAGDVVTARLISLEGISGARIEWSIFGTHGSTAPELTEGGTPVGQEVSFTVPAGLLPYGGAYGLRCDVNGGADVTKQAAATKKSAIYVRDCFGQRPPFLGETFEGDPAFAYIPRLRAGMSKGIVHTDVSGAVYSVAAVDRVLLCDTSSNAITVNLPDAAGATGKTLTVKDTGNAGTNAITIDGSGSQTIDGSTTLSLSTAYAAVTLFCDGAGWHVVSTI